MAAALDRAAFFAAVRLDPFPARLTASQVTGMEAILDACPPDTPLDHLAYCLGTAPVETAWSMLPIKEMGGPLYYTRMYDITGERPAKARELGNLSPGDGAKFCGRGYVQLTGRSNYRRATSRLRDLGLIDRSQDLEATPDLAMHPDIAAAILFVGTREGWFTGRKLADYFGPGKADWTGARRIINGQDRAGEIGGHARAFRNGLVAAGYRPGGVSVAVPTPPVTVTPLPSPPPVLIPPAPMPTISSSVPATPLPAPPDIPAPRPPAPVLPPPAVVSAPSWGSRLASWLSRPWFG
ncbi:hypothetical protein [Methylobacterium sp. Leaf399]|uniref:hypothetical protein n=1 Tax=Methylobacterium sp. Leaf399 TaxID=1736364 RepID=UPI001AEC16C1|nr:hypothetical protein [Methylobacterium sp. Leaf399]